MRAGGKSCYSLILVFAWGRNLTSIGLLGRSDLVLFVLSLFEG